MFFGLATFGIYLYLVSNFDSITLGEGKTYLIILPIIFIFAFVELFCEIKYGFRKLLSSIKKGVIKLHKKIKFKILTKQIDKGKKPSDKNLEWLAKQKGANNDN